MADCKWKVPTRDLPSVAVLRQMFAYSHRFGAHHTALIYPSSRAAQESISGQFVEQERACRTLFIDLFSEGHFSRAGVEAQLQEALLVRLDQPGRAM